MDFNYTPEQEMLKESAASFAKKESPPGRIRKLREDPLGYSKTLWKQMGDLGWLGLAFPEAQGGYGGSFLDLALILEQLGTTLVPEPILPSVVLAGLTISRLGTEAQRERFLAPMIAGDSTLAFAYAEVGGRFDPARQSTRARRDGDGYRLTGEKIFVLNGHAADHIVISARTSGEDPERAGLSLFVVDRESEGLSVEPIQMMDGHRGARLRFTDLYVPKDRLLGEEGGAIEEIEHALDRGAAAVCAEGLGIMQTVLFMTCEYLNTRKQFGVVIGSFQALQHRAVDMFVETELAKGTMLLAALSLDKPAEERAGAVSVAKTQLAVGGRFVTQQAIQLHGGIGITDEHDVGLYFKRMHIINTLFGDEEYHVQRYASLPSFTADIAAAG